MVMNTAHAEEFKGVAPGCGEIDPRLHPPYARLPTKSRLLSSARSSRLNPSSRPGVAAGVRIIPNVPQAEGIDRRWRSVVREGSPDDNAS